MEIQICLVKSLLLLECKNGIPECLGNVAYDKFSSLETSMPIDHGKQGQTAGRCGPGGNKDPLKITNMRDLLSLHSEIWDDQNAVLLVRAATCNNNSTRVSNSSVRG